jgi:hypothetical protein
VILPGLFCGLSSNLRPAFTDDSASVDDLVLFPLALRERVAEGRVREGARPSRCHNLTWCIYKATWSVMSEFPHPSPLPEGEGASFEGETRETEHCWHRANCGRKCPRPTGEGGRRPGEGGYPSRDRCHNLTWCKRQATRSSWTASLALSLSLSWCTCHPTTSLSLPPCWAFL